MAVQRTLSIIKPDATSANLLGRIIARFEEEGLKISGIRKIWMSKEEAEGFYAVHRERPFFGELVEFMTRGPVVVSVLEGESAITRYRELMGATNPENAAEGTIRKLHARDVGENAVHGSDAPETAANEVRYFFPGYEV